MSRGRRRSYRLVLPLLLVLGAAALAVGTMLRREDRTAPWLAPAPAGPAAAPPAPAPAPAAPAPAAPAPAAGQAATGDSVESLLRLSRRELYARAQAHDIPGRSRMSKRELAEALAASG